MPATDITVSAADRALISTAYGANGSITLSGNNDITTASIISESTENKQLIIKDGKFTVDKIVDDSEKAAVTISGGTFSQDFSNLCEDGYAMGTTEDGSRTLTPATKWATMTDAGFYLDSNDEKLGMMRFSFKVTPAADFGEISAAGIKYLKTADGDFTAAKGVEGVWTNNALYGNLVGIADGTTGTYYAKAYTKNADNNTVWSDVLDCAISRNKHFTAYHPGGEN